MALVLGFFGGAAVALSSSLQWPTWVMFIAWVSYYLFGKSLRTSLMPFVQIALGIAMGVLIRLSATSLGSVAGTWGLPIAVFFFIGSLAYISRHTKLNNIPAWFLGLIVFFGVHPPVEFVPILSLLIPIVAGFILAWINDQAVQTVMKSTSIKKETV